MGGVDAWQGFLDHGEVVGPHLHEFGQLVYPASGLLVTTTDRGTWATPADQIAWTPPGFTHEHRTYGVTDIRVVEVPWRRCAELPDQPGIFAVSPLLREAVLSLTSGRAFADVPRDRLRDVVVDELVTMPEQHLHLPEPGDDRLRAVTRRLHEEPGSTLTLAQLGREVGASERTLSRLFKTELGMSFHQWRTLLRVQRALIHLARGLTVTETAVRLGWANPTSFTEAFRAVVGQTPGRYASGGADR
ncbi:helix-turn-helix domain-containing protein [Lentzea sp. NPDC059081]|uniref:helix-turn-helix domain-containing protein n=1 Tax=Lentzea sp. NPDC059081 TaxID=3346719 RepID=UPI0036B0C5DE